MRLFVALDIPEDVRVAIAALVTNLRVASPDGRWVRVEGMHITLKFIGDVAVETAEQIKTTLANISFPATIKMSFHDLGFFPNQRRPRVLWVGIEAGLELGELSAAVETALEPLGIPREQRAFAPHLSLARFDSPRGLDGLKVAISEARSLEFGRTITKTFHLYQSVLKRGGAEYTRLATYHLAEGKSL